MLAHIKIRNFLIAWVSGGIAIFVLLSVFTSLAAKGHAWWFGYLQLVRSGGDAEAMVVRTEPGNHCRAEYTFTVAGQSYFGSAPDCSARIGQKVPITYRLADPTHSCLGSARERLNNELISLFAGGVMFPPIIIWRILAFRRKMKQKVK